jgi:hypothetical protein
LGSSDARETNERHIEGSFKPKAARVALYFFPTPKLVTYRESEESNSF